MLFEQNPEMLQEVIKLSGILLKKAEISKNYKNFYLEIYEKLSYLQMYERDAITVLGEPAW